LLNFYFHFGVGMEEVVGVYENKYHKLHTTRSWDFIGLPQTAKRSLKTESNIIVALFDTGFINFNFTCLNSNN